MKLRLVPPVVLMALSVSLSASAVEVRDVTFSTKDAGKVVFSHKRHMRQKDMAGNCKACHDSIFSIKRKSHSTMADMAKGRSCGACHNGRQAFTLEECARCHTTKEITYAVAATGPTPFSHKRHLSATPDCGACHPKLFAAGRNRHTSMDEMKKGKSCGACHDGKRAFALDDCAACHPAKDLDIRVAQTGPTRFSHTVHTRRHGCGDCHPALYKPTARNRRITMAEMQKGASCGRCHDGKAAFAVTECVRCHPTRELTFPVKEIRGVPFSHAFHLGLYTCKDCHPKLFAAARSAKRVTMGEMRKGASCGACHDGKSAFSVRGRCDTCHTS